MILNEVKIRVVRYFERPSTFELRIQVKTNGDEFNLQETYPLDDFETVFDHVWR